MFLCFFALNTKRIIKREKKDFAFFSLRPGKYLCEPQPIKLLLLPLRRPTFFTFSLLHPTFPSSYKNTIYFFCSFYRCPTLLSRTYYVKFIHAKPHGNRKCLEELKSSTKHCKIHGVSDRRARSIKTKIWNKYLYIIQKNIKINEINLYF